MFAIIIIISVVALVSVYDFFSTRNWQQVTSAVRNETVFENRNKKYGAFVIRKDYNRSLLLIMLGLVGGVGVIYAATAINKTIEKAVVKPPKMDDTAIALDFKKEVEPEVPEIETPKEEIAKPEETYKFIPPVAVDTPTDDEVPVIDPNKKAGTITVIPIDPGFPIDPKDPEPPKKITEPIPTGPETIVDEFAEYPGGHAARIRFLMENLVYPQIAVENNIQGKCHLRFVVSKTGEISDVEVVKKVKDCPQCDKEAQRVLRKMPRWKPGKKNGKVVDSYFNMPINFELKD